MQQEMMLLVDSYILPLPQQELFTTLPAFSSNVSHKKSSMKRRDYVQSPLGDMGETKNRSVKKLKK